VTNQTCRAKTKAGAPCRAKAAANGLCPIHSDPDRAAELGRMSGKSRRHEEKSSLLLPDPRTAHDVHEALSLVFVEVGAGNANVKVGTTLAYIASVLLKTIEVSEHETLLRAIEMMISRRSEK
jgi:hypothetical protein